MHKGYTINYFIKFFSSIPANRWHCGAFTNRNDLEDGYCRTMKACALGYAGAYKVEKEEYETNTEYFETDATTPVREEALKDLLDQVEAINDNNYGEYNYLGSTPRTRILNALKLRKKYGRNWNHTIE